MKRKQITLLVINTALLLLFALLSSVDNRAARFVLPAMELSTAWTIFTLTHNLPKRNLFWNYHLLALMMLCRSILDLWKYLQLPGDFAVPGNPPLFTLYLIPSLLTLGSAVSYLCTTAKYYDRTQLQLDSYKITIVASCIFAGSTLSASQINFLLQAEFSPFWITSVLHVLATSATVVIAFIILTSRRSKRNLPVYGGVTLFYLLISCRQILLFYHIKGVLTIGASFAMILLALASWLLSITVIYRDVLYRSNRLTPFDREQNTPENIGVSRVMLYLQGAAILFWLLQLLSGPTLITITLITATLQGLDYFAQKAYTINRRLEQELITDSLTNLYNRNCFIQEINRRISERTQEFTIFYVDIDHFKTINVIHGHTAGDRVLRCLGRRLRQVGGPETFVSRCGSDEFGLIINGKNESLINTTGRKISEIIRRKINLDGVEVHIDASIGAARYPDDASTPQDLLRSADMAVYSARQDVESSCRLHSSRISAEMERRNRLEQLLRNADPATDFTLYYQPQVELAGGTVIGAEALTRWFHKEEGTIPPVEFIPIIEEIGLSNSFTEWVFTKAMTQVRHWNTTYDRELVVSVNVSPRFLHRAGFYDRFFELLHQSGINPAWLGVEITEYSAMLSPGHIQKVLRAIGGQKVKVSIDDFGTGYSSLSYLKRFQVNELKIDKELIDNIAVDPDERLIVNAILMMASGLGLQTVAEGVESVEQLQVLKELNCDIVQGYYFSRPLPTAEFETQFLRRTPSRTP